MRKNKYLETLKKLFYKARENTFINKYFVVGFIFDHIKIDLLGGFHTPHIGRLNLCRFKSPLDLPQNNSQIPS